MAENQESLPKITIGDEDIFFSLAIDRRKHMFVVRCQTTFTNEDKEQLQNFVELTLSYDEAAAVSNTISAWLSARG